MCLAMTVEYACSRCEGTVMRDAYQVPRTACAEAAAKGPGFFGACQRGVERRTQRQRCPDDDDSEKDGEEQPAGYRRRRRLLLRGERLCAGCEIDDEIRGLDADSALLDPTGAAPSSASSTATATGGEEDEDEEGNSDDDLEILPFWIERANRRHRQARVRAFETPLTLRGGSGSGADDEEDDDDSGDDDDEDGGASLDDDDEDDDEDGGAKL